MEQLTEAHASLVARRAGDDSFVQRTRNPDGSSFVTIAKGDRDGFRTIVEAQQAAFRAKFGREMGPEDPLFFDPDEDEPTFITSEKDRQDTIDFAATLEDPVLRAHVLASADVGYIVTEANEHTFSAHEKAAYFDAVEHHLEAD